MRFRVYYATPKKASKFWTMPMYSDKGDLYAGKDSLIFQGRRFRIEMNDVAGFELQKMKGGLGMKQVEVIFRSPDGVEQRAYFFGQRSPTAEIYESLTSLFSPRDTGEVTCEDCGAAIPAGNLFCGKCAAAVSEAPLHLAAREKPSTTKGGEGQVDRKKPTIPGRLTDTHIWKARKGQLQEWCKQRGLEDDGLVNDLRARLLEYMSQPYIPPSEYVPPPQKEYKTSEVVVGFVILVVIIGAIVGGVWWAMSAFSGGGEEALSESEESAYFASLADIFGDGADSLDDVNNIVNAWVPGVNDNTILRKLDVELSIMKSIRDRVNNLAILCSAYSGMHSDIMSAYNNYVSAYEWTILAIETYDVDVLDTSVDFFRQGNADLGRGQTRITLLQETVPNC